MDNETILKLKIRPYWDFPQNYNSKEKSGIFIGREQEQEKLIDIFTRKKCGSILLCGPRGVGKTTLVYKALKEVRSKEEKIIPVVLNVSQIEAEIDEKLTHKDILINLIRRLYTAIKKEKSSLLTEEMEDLYFKSAAKNWQLEKVMEEATEKEIEKQDVERTALTQLIKQIKQINLLKTIGAIFFILTILLAFKSEIVYTVISGMLGLGSFFYEDIKSLEIRIEVRQIFRRLRRKKDLAKETYLIDNSVGNLEYELSEVLSELASKNKKQKIIFIVDELDKYSEEPQNILHLIKTYKNLFSLTSALFLFITGSEIYEVLFDIPKHRGSLLKDDSKNNIASELYRTTFSEVFYLSRPNYNDISNYLDQILEEKEFEKLKGDKEQLKRWEEFKHYLGFESEDDFFELIRLIKNFTKKEKTNKIHLEITQKDFLDKEKTKAKFHKALFLIYRDSSFSKPTEWAYNESLYFGLFDVVKILDASSSQIQLAFNKEKDEIKESQKKLIDVLEKVGAIQVTQRDDNQVVFSWTHKDFEIGDTIEGAYPHEEKFIKAFDELLIFSQRLVEIFGKTFSTEEESINWVQSVSGISVASNFNLFKEAKAKINQNEHLNIEETTKYEEELKNELQNLYKNILGTYVNGLLQLLTGAQQGKLDQNSNLFSLLDSEIKEKIKGYSHLIVYKPNLSKQILIIENYSREDLLKLNEWNKDFNFSYKIINIENDTKHGIQSIKNVKVDDIIEWFNNMEIKLNIGGISEADVISGIPSKEKMKRKLYLKLNKTEGIVIDGKNPHTFLIIDKEYTDFNAIIEVLLKDNGIFNFVFGFNENENKQPSFYMIRLDAREGHKNSLFQANYGNSWNSIVEGQSMTSSNISHILEVLLKNNNLQVILDKNPIISHTFPQEIKGKIGLMNELEDVFLRKIKFK